MYILNKDLKGDSLAKEIKNRESDKYLIDDLRTLSHGFDESYDGSLGVYYLDGFIVVLNCAYVRIIDKLNID